MNIVRSFRLWLVALVAVAALVVVTSPHATTYVQRVAHLETLIRCPSCEGLSVAQSNATSAIAVRHEIERKVKAGQSDSAIITSLESTYGASILLSPSTSGLGVVLWLVPVAGVLLLVIIGVRVARRR